MVVIPPLFFKRNLISTCLSNRPNKKELLIRNWQIAKFFFKIQTGHILLIWIEAKLTILPAKKAEKNSFLDTVGAA